MQRNPRIIIPAAGSIKKSAGRCIDVISQAVCFIKKVICSGINIQLVFILKRLSPANPPAQQMIRSGRSRIAIIQKNGGSGIVSCIRIKSFFELQVGKR